MWVCVCVCVCVCVGRVVRVALHHNEATHHNVVLIYTEISCRGACPTSLSDQPPISAYCKPAMISTQVRDMNTFWCIKDRPRCYSTDHPLHRTPSHYTGHRPTTQDTVPLHRSCKNTSTIPFGMGAHFATGIPVGHRLYMQFTRPFPLFAKVSLA